MEDTSPIYSLSEPSLPGFTPTPELPPSCATTDCSKSPGGGSSVRLSEPDGEHHDQPDVRHHVSCGHSINSSQRRTVSRPIGLFQPEPPLRQWSDAVSQRPKVCPVQPICSLPAEHRLVTELNQHGANHQQSSSWRRQNLNLDPPRFVGKGEQFPCQASEEGSHSSSFFSREEGWVALGLPSSTQPISSPVVGVLSARLRQSISAWRAIGAGPVLLSWIQYGYRLPFQRQLQPFDHHRPPSTSSEAALLVQERDRLLLQGTLREVPSAQYISHCRLEPKPDGRWRLIVDLRHLNLHLVTSPCHYETIDLLPTILYHNDWMTSFDLKDGYHHLGIHPSHQQFLAVSIGGRTFLFTELMFGLRPACRVFTKLMRPLVRLFRAHNIRVHPYLDDFLLITNQQAASQLVMNNVLQLLQMLGLEPNLKKCVLLPTQCLTHLGYVVNTSTMTFAVPTKKALRLRSEALVLIKYATHHRRWVSKARLASLTGLLMSLRLAIPSVRTHAHSLYRAMSSTVGWRGDVRLGSQALKDLQWIHNLQQIDMCMSMLLPQPTITVYTDASDTAWGVTSSIGEVQGFFSPEEIRHHITWKELQSVTRALQHHGPTFQGLSIRLMTDNMTTMAIMNKGTSRSPVLMAEYRIIHQLLLQYKVAITANYINTALNVRADFLSRMTEKSEWELCDLLFQQLQGDLGEFTVDRFASAKTKKCKLFNSLVLSPGSCGDAFDVLWTGHNNWINPPFALIPRIIAKLRQERAGGVLVVPYWPSQPWWPALLALSTSIRVLSVSDTHRAVICHSQCTPEPLRNRRWRLAFAVVPFLLGAQLSC